MKSWGIQSIAGNVELQVRNKEADCGCDFKNGGRCDLFSRNWYSYIQSRIDGPSIEWLHTLPHHIVLEYGKQKLTIVHGSWFHTADFIFASTPWPVKQETLQQQGPILLLPAIAVFHFMMNRMAKGGSIQV